MTMEQRHRQLNRKEIEACLKSAVMDLTPDVLDRIDLSTPQIKEETSDRSEKLVAIRRRMTAVLAAACFCVVALLGGTYTYRNQKVDSVIGIDVNPSVELSVNRKNKVLEAQALNGDAEKIMEGMDLKGVDLKVAVNAVIGSMATNGYFNELADNAILVTVSNDSMKKAASLRTSVVSDIKTTLEEKKLKAVVYDQQAVEEDQVKQLAKEYGISYGKAYFLKELISQNSSLTMEDMKELAPLTMEEIAKVIAERSYAVGQKTGVTEETPEETQTEAETATEEESSEETSVPEESPEEPSSSEAASQTQAQTGSPQTQPPATTAAAEETSTEEVVVSTEKIKIDYVDYYNGIVTVNFKTKVKWKNPTVSVKDEDGTSYSAKVEDTSSDSCEIQVTGLSGDTEYTFVLGGISPKGGRQTTVTGVFETPVVGDGYADPEVDEEETEETEEPDKESNADSGEKASKEASDGQKTEAGTSAGQEAETAGSAS